MSVHMGTHQHTYIMHVAYNFCTVAHNVDDILNIVILCECVCPQNLQQVVIEQYKRACS